MKRMFEIWEMWDWLIDNGIATEDELKLITKMKGYNIYVLNDVLYYRTGYHNREQWEKGRNTMTNEELNIKELFEKLEVRSGIRKWVKELIDEIEKEKEEK